MAFALPKETKNLARKKNRNNVEAYEKQIETCTMRNAAENGYFRTLTFEDVLGQIEPSEDGYPTDMNTDLLSKVDPSREDSLNRVYMLRFHAARLRSLAIINHCQNLTICDLSCNYLQKIDALMQCKSLVKLDVHQNQISELPREDFWISLSNLSVVYLHDNGISTFDELKKLRVAQSLVILTLHDTPVSIKPHYRHFVVNSIWSLKALDNVVISDEELIEDAKFGDKFKAMQPHLSFKPKSLTKLANASYEEEKSSVLADIAMVNKIQSKFCPVLILQKCIRGFLIRMRYEYFQDTRLWAAVTIQRFYRKYRELEFPGINVSSIEMPYLSLSSPRLDYETYMKYRKSNGKGVISDLTLSQIAVTAENSLEASGMFQNASNVSVNGLGGNFRPKVRLSINLNKLVASTDKILDESSDSVGSSAKNKVRETIQPTASLKPSDLDLKSLSKASGIDFVPLDKCEGKKDKRYSGKYFTQYKFLGPVKQASDKKNESINKNIDANEGKVPFRLSSTKPPRIGDDFFEETMMKTIEIARDIRESMREFERRRAAAPKVVAERRYPVTTDQKLFIRTHGTMALTCFRAVEQAYRDRDRAEIMLDKTTRVREMKQAREQSSEMLKQTKSAAVERMFTENANEKREIASILEDKRSNFAERQKTYVSERATARTGEIQRKKNRKLMVEFVCQNNAVAKALAKHAISSAKEKTADEKSLKLNDIKDNTCQQKEVIRRFYEHRNLVLQSENAIARSKLIDTITHKSKEREEEAQLRVKKLQNQKVQKPVPVLTVASAPPRLPPLAVVSDTKWNEWEKIPKKETKRRIHDRVSIWT